MPECAYTYIEHKDTSFSESSVTIYDHIHDQSFHLTGANAYTFLEHQDRLEIDSDSLGNLTLTDKRTGEVITAKKTVRTRESEGGGGILCLLFMMAALAIVNLMKPCIAAPAIAAGMLLHFPVGSLVFAAMFAWCVVASLHARSGALGDSQFWLLPGVIVFTIVSMLILWFGYHPYQLEIHDLESFLTVVLSCMEAFCFWYMLFCVMYTPAALLTLNFRSLLGSILLYGMQLSVLMLIYLVMLRILGEPTSLYVPQTVSALPAFMQMLPYNTMPYTLLINLLENNVFRLSNGELTRYALYGVGAFGLLLGLRAWIRSALETRAAQLRRSREKQLRQ